MEAHERIIFPLDVDTLDEAVHYLGALKHRVGLVKIGYSLLIREGRSVLDQLHELAGVPLFVDLKFHDIPRTVQQAASALVAASDHIRFLTVHTCDGEAIVRAAVAGVKPGVGVLGVTVLTSLPAGDDAENTQGRVVSLATLARRAGCEGIVCSGHEVQAVKAALGRECLVVVPGIRPDWAEITHDDQRRAMTPAQAIAAGADYLVVGRPIAAAKDPAGAAEWISDEIARAFASRPA
ncbi:MAG TPA: orotidine-5'-phosphate decarboxylase [Nitrospiria bacterium]|nr:orotidine-5'-phosphate decarboxylase [Nitrospiria bacterium]